MGDLILGIVGFALTAAAAYGVFQCFRAIHIISAAEIAEDMWWPEEDDGGDRETDGTG